MPAGELRELRALANEHHVPLKTFMPSLSALFWSVDAVVCMGGYNTLAEAASKGVPIVCVPRMAPRAEQSIRAKAFERLGLAQMLPPNELNASTLRKATDTALGITRERLLERAQTALNFDGAERAAKHLLSVAEPQRRAAQKARTATAA
jgi:predicted glycosyltransferase